MVNSERSELAKLHSAPGGGWTMLTIAGGIILAIIILWVGGLLVAGMFSGFSHSRKMGCLTMAVFGATLLMLAMCVFG